MGRRLLLARMRRVNVTEPRTSSNAADEVYLAVEALTHWSIFDIEESLGESGTFLVEMEQNMIQISVHSKDDY